MNRVVIFWGSIIACAVQSSCNVINPAEPTPTYVHIDSFNMQSNINVPGSNSHKITNVWVYYNNHSVGVFNLPVTVPIITEGPNGVLRLQPGIDANGFSTMEIQYPFYRADTITITSRPGQVIHYQPTTSYYSSTDVKLNIDFEANNGFDNVAGAPIIATKEQDKVYEGIGSGRIVLNNPGDSSVSKSTGFDLPYDHESYLELNYKGTASLQLGLKTTDKLGVDQSEYLIGLNPRAEWGKIYISLSAFAATYQTAKYYLLLRAGAAESGGAEVNIDNVKVVSMKP